MGNTMMKPTEIRLLHRSLEKEIRAALEFAKLGIGQPLVGGDWSNAAVESRVVFELLYEGTHQQQTAQRERGGRCSVFALHANNAADALRSRYWVSWFEEWQVKVARQDLELCTAGWSVFAGPPNQEMQQIIRAEWDQLPITGSQRSGQPHWHVDRYPQLETQAYDTTTVAAPGDATLMIASTVDGAQALAGLHLAMGAWNGKLDHPECWQRLASKTDGLLTWGIKTLEYLKSEFPA
jgi:hypothetical protein